MKHTTVLTLALLLTIAATPAFAAPNENKSNNGKANGQNKEEQAEKKAVQALEVTIAPSEVPAVSAAPSQAVSPTWKNHGEYVSSVAKTHPGGKVVSQAARSDIGKKQKAPTPSVSVAPSIVPSVEPSVEPTQTVTPPITAPVEAITVSNPFASFLNFLQNITRFMDPFKTV